MKIVVSEKYSVNLGGHVFETGKFIAAARLAADEKNFVAPPSPRRQDLLLVHSPEWADKVISCKLTPDDEKLAEIPVTPEVSLAHQLACSGTALACELALKDGLGLHAGGGGHHAFRDHGEGFCILNDIAVGIEKLRKSGTIKKAAVVDLDAHQGNGTAGIFARTPEVFTFSMHEAAIFPEKKEKSSLDVELETGMGGKRYIELLAENLPKVLDGHKPELVVYLAGADCCEHDKLAGLKLKMDDLLARDEYVFRQCFSRRIPVAVVLGGGYAENPQDTIRIHAGTLSLAAEIRAKFC